MYWSIFPPVPLSRSVYNDAYSSFRDFLSLICNALKCFATVGGKRCCFYMAKLENIDLLLQKVRHMFLKNRFHLDLAVS